jgi:hypothetical protein
MSNYKFKTTNIRGKQYVEVNERIKFFRQEDQYKHWTIATDFPVLDEENALCKCTIANETSAVGRALAMLGIGIDTSIASANEVEEAIAKQQALVENPHVQKLSKTLDAPVENIMDKAVGYIKSQTDKKKAFEAITKKYGEQLTEKQVSGLQKFVR